LVSDDAVGKISASFEKAEPNIYSRSIHNDIGAVRQATNALGYF